jgi:hypothetical protein
MAHRFIPATCQRHAARVIEDSIRFNQPRFSLPGGLDGDNK